MRVFAIILVFALVFVTTPAAARPNVESFGEGADTVSEDYRALLDAASPQLRAKLEKYLSELAIIQEDTDRAIEFYEEAERRLVAVQSDIAQREADLDALNAAYARQARVLSERAVELYKTGHATPLMLLLDSDSITDLVHRFNYIRTINAADNSHMERIAAERERQQSALRQLLIDQHEAEGLEFELKARKIEIEERNRLREELLAKQSPDVARIARAYREVQEQRNAVEAAQAGTDRSQP